MIIFVYIYCSCLHRVVCWWLGRRRYGQGQGRLWQVYDWTGQVGQQDCRLNGQANGESWDQRQLIMYAQ